MKRIILLVVFLLSVNLSYAQGNYTITEEDYNNTSIEMADTMRSNGKIYVVVAVVMVVFSGLIFYMVQTERKISRIEKEVFKKKGDS